MHLLHFLITAGLTSYGLFAAGKTVTQIESKDLPEAVRTAALQRKPKDGALSGFEKELIDGKTFYEVKITAPNGRGKEFLFHPDGTIAEVEEESSITAIPAPARAAIQRAAASGKLVKVDVITRGRQTYYEGEIRFGETKKSLRFDASGKPVN